MKGPKPGRRCRLCGRGIFELKQLVEITWVKQRGRYLPAICAGCFNRLWAVSVSIAEAPIKDSLAKPARQRIAVDPFTGLPQLRTGPR